MKVTAYVSVPKVKERPVGGLFDKDAQGENRFVYVSAVKTDIRKTFARIREQQKKGNIL